MRNLQIPIWSAQGTRFVARWWWPSFLPCLERLHCRAGREGGDAAGSRVPEPDARVGGRPRAERSRDRGRPMVGVDQLRSRLPRQRVPARRVLRSRAADASARHCADRHQEGERDLHRPCALRSHVGCGNRREADRSAGDRRVVRERGPDEGRRAREAVQGGEGRRGHAVSRRDRRGRARPSQRDRDDRAGGVPGEAGRGARDRVAAEAAHRRREAADSTPSARAAAAIRRSRIRV